MASIDTDSLRARLATRRPPPVVQQPTRRAIFAGSGLTAGVRYNPNFDMSRAVQPGTGPQTTPLSFTGTPKSQAQNSFLTAIQGQTRANQPIKNNSLASFVRESYARGGKTSAALDSDLSMIDKVFAKDGGLANELINTRAKRSAGILMRVKDAMNKARRSDASRRMMSGNNTYNDRLYADNLGRVAADAAVQDADLERDDLRYLTGARTGLLGARGRLTDQYLGSLLNPGKAVTSFAKDDLDVLNDFARLENQNTVYESPLDSLRRQMEMSRAQDEFDGLRYFS
jgi:hypothetical protein